MAKKHGAASIHLKLIIKNITALSYYYYYFTKLFAVPSKLFQRHSKKMLTRLKYTCMPRTVYVDIECNKYFMGINLIDGGRVVRRCWV